MAQRPAPPSPWGSLGGNKPPPSALGPGEEPSYSCCQDPGPPSFSKLGPGGLGAHPLRHLMSPDLHRE